MTIGSWFTTSAVPVPASPDRAEELVAVHLDQHRAREGVTLDRVLRPMCSECCDLDIDVVADVDRHQAAAVPERVIVDRIGCAGAHAQHLVGTIAATLVLGAPARRQHETGDVAGRHHAGRPRLLPRDSELAEVLTLAEL